MKSFLFWIPILISPFVFSIQSNAQTQKCANYELVKGFNSSLSKKCLGLVINDQSIPWKQPREVLFKDSQTLLVSDLGGWAHIDKGAVWQINLKTLKFFKVYDKGNKTHGLALDSKKRVLVGDVDRIIRLDEKNKVQTIITGLPTEGSHPLSQFIVLPNNDIVLNIGAPSDNCSEEMGTGTHCNSRDNQGELRLYSYEFSTDRYSDQFKVLGRGLRNSMALLYNPLLEEIYQGENNMDQLGTVEEFNIVPLRSDSLYDFGWPFCIGQHQEASHLKASFKNFCDSRTQSPEFLIPAHSAPLDMIYYKGKEHPELENSILMSWHGHRRTVESSLVAYDINEQGAPIVETNGINPFLQVLSGKNSQGQKLRPAGVDVDSSGKIWFTDDVTKRLYVFASTENQIDNNLDTVSEASVLIKKLPTQQLVEFDKIYTDFQNTQTCNKCHSPEDFPQDSTQALIQWVKKSWISKGIQTTDMTLIQRINPETISPRSMPPPPQDPYGKENPQVYKELKLWLDSNFSY